MQQNRKMEILKILLATIVATSLMTLFSYIISKKRNKQFREPELLAAIIGQFSFLQNPRHYVIAGWAVHYTIGLLFVVVYDQIWRHTSLDATWFCGILFGIASGIVGIFGWRMIFGIAPRIPRTDFKAYFLHLLLAHIVFALGAVAVYAVLR